MKRTFFAFAALCMVAVCMGQDQSPFERQLKAVEEERDALRRELALAKLKIATLESKISAMEKAAGSAGSSTTSSEPSADDDDTDDSGVSKTTKSWTVKVISKKRLDVSEIASEIKQLNGVAASARGEIASATRRVDDMRRQNESWDRFYRSSSNKTKPFSDDVIARARLDIQKAQTKERSASRRVLGLEREKAEASKTLVLTCESTVDASVLRLMAKGVSIEAGEAMVEGQKYTVEGRKGGIDVIILTKVKVLSE